MSKSVESKILEILNEGYPGAGKVKETEPMAQGSSQRTATASMGVKGAPSEPKPANAPAAGVAVKEDKPMKQGSSKDAEHEDLGTDEAGKKAAAKQSKQPVPTAKGAGPAKDFVTVADPTTVISQTSNKGNVVKEEKVTVELDKDDDDDKDDDKKGDKKDKKDDDKKDGKKKLFGEGLDVANFFESDASLTEEFKVKAKSLFEAVVTARVSALREELETEVAQEAATAVAVIKEDLVAKLDTYLTLVTEEWLKDNVVAVEAGVRHEISENFMLGLKTLFETNYIEVPAEKVDVVGQMTEEIAGLEAKLTESVDAAAELQAQITELQKAQVLATMTEGLAQTEVERLTQLVEDVTFESADLYKSKLTVIKETYFPKANSTGSSILTEEITAPETQEVSAVIQSYVAAIDRLGR
jgi:AcrR family transcriptional regulator